MKTANVSQTPAMPGTAATKAASAPAAGVTDFMALFTQVLDGTTPSGAATPTNLLAAALPFGATGEKSEPADDLDEADVEMMMAAITGAPMLPPTPVFTAPTDLGDKDLLAGVRANELTGAMVDVLAGQTEATEGAAQSDTFDSVLTSTDATLDPRAAQSAIDTLRDIRAAQPTEAPVQRQMHAPVGTRAWSDELGANINLMTERGQSAASLKLSPEHLGPLEVRISIRDDQASVWFGAAHADTRAAIENALPRLRDMMASQGLVLTDAGVFKEAPQQQQPKFTSGSGQDGGDAAAATDEARSVSVSRLGLVDAYA